MKQTTERQLGLEHTLFTTVYNALGSLKTYPFQQELLASVFSEREMKIML